MSEMCEFEREFECNPPQCQANCSVVLNALEGGEREKTLGLTVGEVRPRYECALEKSKAWLMNFHERGC